MSYLLIGHGPDTPPVKIALALHIFSSLLLFSCLHGKNRKANLFNTTYKACSRATTYFF